MIYGIVNDGSKQYFKERDGDGQFFGACFRDFRNSPMPYWIQVTYVDKKLTVETAHHGHFYEKCFEKDNVDLPKGYYFGVSASTGSENPDQHDLYMLEVYHLRPPKKVRTGKLF